MALYNDYDALFERFSIMTESPTANYTAALEYCCNNTTPELAERLRNETMQAVQLPETQTADYETLSKYIAAGFGVYPCIYQNGNTSPICKIYYANGAIITTNRITNKDRLKTFMQGGGECITDDGKKWINKKAIEMFAIYPIQYNLFCLDIDAKTKQDGTTHGTGTNGIDEFLNIIQHTDLTEKQKQLFENFPFNFPCYVSTPSGGIHLYFKIAKLPNNWKQYGNVFYNGLETNIECKYNKQITIAGSTKNGKRYELHGDFENIPFIPMDLLNKCCKPREIKEPVKPRPYKIYEYKKDETPTPQFCIDRGKSLAGYNGGRHNLFCSVVGCFAGFYKTTNDESLNAETCRRYILQDYDFLSWKDNDKESQINQIIKDFYGV